MKSNIRSLLNQAIMHHQNQQFEQAEELCIQILEIAPECHQALHLYGLLAAQLGAYEQGEEAIREALKIEVIPQYYLDLSLNLKNQGQFQQALIELKTLLQITPDSLTVIQRMAELYQLINQPEQAISLFQQALKSQPDSLEINFHLACLLKDFKPTEAEHFFQQTLKSSPHYRPAIETYVSFLINQKAYSKALKVLNNSHKHLSQSAFIYHQLGLIHYFQENFELATRNLQLSLELNPALQDAHELLLSVLVKQNKYEEALENINPCLSQPLKRPETYLSLGHIYMHLKQFEEAIKYYSIAKETPQIAQEALNSIGLYHTQMGKHFQQLGQLEQALEHFNKALTYQPVNFDACLELGNIYYQQQRMTQALEHYHKALQQQPQNSGLYLNIGSIYQTQGLLDQAIDFYQRGLKINPESAAIYTNLGVALKDQGKLPQALTTFQKAIELLPDNLEAYSNFLYCAQSVANQSNTEIFQYYRVWEKRFAEHLYPLKAPTITPSSKTTPIKVGYISPDFRHHSTNSVFETLFNHHNSQLFEIHAYSNTLREDLITQKFKTIVPHWHPISYMKDEEIAQMIQNHQIDILVDLAGHTARNKLLVFARKPAPIQVTGLGMSMSSGLKSIDYRFSDPFVTPPQMVTFNSEKIIYLKTILCWQEPDFELALKAPPCLSNGHITFGCGNNLFKINEKVIALWANILKKEPRSKIHLKAKQFNDLSMQESFRKQFKEQGVKADRILFSGETSHKEHLNFYQSIDIALDPFPYDGGITSCESLWMGVPFISLALPGEKSVGKSILAQVDLQENATSSQKEYIHAALNWASDFNRLHQAKEELRQSFLNSPICNGKQYVRTIENAYLTMIELAVK